MYLGFFNLDDPHKMHEVDMMMKNEEEDDDENEM